MFTPEDWIDPGEEAVISILNCYRENRMLREENKELLKYKKKYEDMLSQSLQNARDTSAAMLQFALAYADKHGGEWMDFLELAELYQCAYPKMEERNMTDWERYCDYLKSWADSHRDGGFEGCCPVCYDEWLCNDEYCSGCALYDNCPGYYDGCFDAVNNKTKG